MDLFLNLFLLHANTSLHPRMSFHSYVTNCSDVPPSSKKFHFKKPFMRLCLRFMLASTRSAVVTLTFKSRRYRRRRCCRRRCSRHGFFTLAAAIVTVCVSPLVPFLYRSLQVPTSGRPGYDEFPVEHFRSTGRESRCRIQWWMENARDRLL